MSAMTHIQIRGDLMWTLFSWSPHQTEILVSSVVTRIVWTGVGLLRIGTCVQWWENSTTDDSDCTIVLMGHMEGNAPLGLLEL